MTRSLLDVNVLISLLDSDHVDHDRARTWIETEADSGWASCAITQNGLVRVISQPRYPSPISAMRAVALLARACDTPWHEFWPCDVSLLSGDEINASRLHSHRQITDAYLLALAVKHDGRLVTFNRAVARSAVPNAAAEHLVVL